MGVHDSYGKDVLSRVLGSQFDRWDSARNVPVGGIGISVDGVIRGGVTHIVNCAVEVEARNEPQVRIAVLNLFLHPAPQALLILMPRNLNNPLPKVLDHVQVLWDRLTRGSRGPLSVACFMGDGDAPSYDEDAAILKDQLARMTLSV